MRVVIVYSNNLKSEAQSLKDDIKTRWSDAEVYYLQALENDPENVYLLKAMVRVTMRLGRPEEAKEWLDKSKEFGG